MSKKQQSDNADFTNNFIIGNRFPVYKLDNLKEVFSNQAVKVEKIPMFVDGKVAWTHIKITLNPKWHSEPYQTDIDVRLSILSGKAWLMLTYKGKNAANMVEAGDIIVIPNGASYNLLNNSGSEVCEYFLDANTLLEISE